MYSDFYQKVKNIFNQKGKSLNYDLTTGYGWLNIHYNMDVFYRKTRLTKSYSAKIHKLILFPFFDE